MAKMVWDNLGVRKDTKKELEELKLEKQQEKGRNISYDELVKDLINAEREEQKKKKEKERESLEKVFMQF